MSTSVETVLAIYEAFARGDIPGVLARFHDDIVWIEAENFPYADGNPYVGPEAVLSGVFARCGSEWEGFGVEIDELIDAGQIVVARGWYTGTYKATGRPQRTQLAHIWRMRDGKVASFQQHADTLHVARVIAK